MQVVVEGSSDEEMARRLVAHCGYPSVHVRSMGGKTKLDPKLKNYSRAARDEPWVVFRDSDNQCPVQLRGTLLAGLPENSLFSLRIAHTMSEAWLMGDRLGFSRYFHVAPATVPAAPEDEPHAKWTVLALCARSRSRKIREGMVASPHEPGPMFTYYLNEFSREHWDVSAAAANCPSLARAICAIRALPRG